MFKLLYFGSLGAIAGMSIFSMTSHQPLRPGAILLFAVYAAIAAMFRDRRI